MHFTLFNLVNALAIGLIIGLMARVTNVRLKATLYTFPIPISIALVATHGVVGSSNVIGLALICSFIVWTYLLHHRLRVPILIADIMAAALYIAVGYVLIKVITVSFTLVSGIYIILWGLLMLRLRRVEAPLTLAKPSAVPPAMKAVATVAVSYVLFSLKDVLAGIVVTFPYSGVFAVLETKNHLEILARVVIRNSMAILAFFITMYWFQSRLVFIINLAAGWVAYLLILFVVQKIPV